MPSNVGAECLRLTADLVARYPASAVKIEGRESSIKLAPADTDTFPIMLYDEGEQVMIAAERWHTHFDDAFDGAYCALWLLTPFYRVVHELKGGVLVAAWIERWEAEGWQGFDPVYFLNPEDEPSWQPVAGEKFARRYAQQAVIPPPAPYESLVPGVNLHGDGLPPDWRTGFWSVVAEGAQGPLLA